MLLKTFKPSFEAGKILSTTMLNDLQSFSYETMKIRYKNYCDGIITGFEFKDHEEQVVLEPGILKFGGKFLFLTERVNVSEMITEDCYLIGRFAEEESFILTTSESYLENEFPFAKIEIDRGAVLYSELDHFEDILKMVKNTFDITVSFSAQINRSLPIRRVMELFGEALIDHPKIGKYTLDYLIAVDCLKGQINWKMLNKFFISKNVKINFEVSIKEIVCSLNSILKNELEPFEINEKKIDNSQIHVN